MHGYGLLLADRRNIPKLRAGSPKVLICFAYLFLLGIANLIASQNRSGFAIHQQERGHGRQAVWVLLFCRSRGLCALGPRARGTWPSGPGPSGADRLPTIGASLSIRPAARNRPLITRSSRCIPGTSLGTRLVAAADDMAIHRPFTARSVSTKTPRPRPGIRVNRLASDQA